MNNLSTPEQEFNRMVILLKAVYDQGSMVRLDMKQLLKRKFNIFDRQVAYLISDIERVMGTDQDAKDYFESMAILYNETLREIEKCKDPKVAIAVLAAINEGCEVVVDGVRIKDYEPLKQQVA